VKRDDELAYAFLPETVCRKHNRYGEPIDLTARSGLSPDESLSINGNESVGWNPDRNKQHGFHFTADNCIGCHACEAACSEKNGLPAHLSFRSVGYVEGGCYPDYTRINISMACNHCDDPVCLKGCPTRAYTKFAEYGAVLQDPDTCFGCGYCTWVCPYNAPQLDPVAGHVQKCNMCVDRLEEGLQPACVSACLGNALDFGVIETTPERRTQTKTELPGFPDPAITKPNIRFEQTRSIPSSFTRPDGEPLKYQLSDANRYLPQVDSDKACAARQWNIAELSSRENPLVAFTLATQACVGAFSILFLGDRLGIESLAALNQTALYLPFLSGLLALQAAVLVLSTLHLGKPWRFYRGFSNLRHSPVSREALGVSIFFGAVSAHWLFALFELDWLTWIPGWMAGPLASFFGWIAVAGGLAGLYFMVRIYRIKARPFWDHWQVGTAFFGTMLSLGGLAIACVWLPQALFDPGSHQAIVATLAGVIGLGLFIEAAGHIFHARHLKRIGGEGAAAQHQQSTRFGNTYLARNVLMGVNLAAALALALGTPSGWFGAALWAASGISIATTAFASRALFYVLVIPTTMPGAFFWRNKAFEQHARETRLANMPQVGVVADAH